LTFTGAFAIITHDSGHYKLSPANPCNCFYLQVLLDSFDN